MTKFAIAFAAAFAAVSGAAYAAGPIHTQTSVQEVVVVAYDKEPLSPRYHTLITRSLATMDMRLRTEIAKASYTQNEAAIRNAIGAPSAEALAFAGS